MKTFKKVFLVLVLAVLVGGTTFAFDYMTYPESVVGSTALVNVGIGIGSGYYTYLDMRIPPIMASVDVPVAIGELPFSVGGFFGISQYGWNYSINNDWSYTTLVFGGRFNYHLNFEVPNIDAYAGVSLGWQMGLWSDDYKKYWDYPGSTYSSLDTGNFYFGLQAGVRYFFTSNLGAFIEAGYGMTYIKAGLALKF